VALHEKVTGRTLFCIVPLFQQSAVG